jgi:hypothetical protein
VLDLGADLGPARDPVDRLADHHIETALRIGGVGEQVADAARAGEREVELLVCAATTSVGEFVGAAGFDVVVVRDDHRVVRQHRLARPQLAGQRQRRVLHVVGRGPPRERDRDQRRTLRPRRIVVCWLVRAADRSYPRRSSRSKAGGSSVSS